jgi:hypothetical protein
MHRHRNSLPSSRDSARRAVSYFKKHIMTKIDNRPTLSQRFIQF